MVRLFWLLQLQQYGVQVSSPHHSPLTSLAHSFSALPSSSLLPSSIDIFIDNPSSSIPSRLVSIDLRGYLPLLWLFLLFCCVLESCSSHALPLCQPTPQSSRPPHSLQIPSPSLRAFDRVHHCEHRILNTPSALLLLVANTLVRRLFIHPIDHLHPERTPFRRIRLPHFIAVI